MTSKPTNPHLVLAAAIALPGCGQVINRQPMRGLMFVGFILLLGAYTLKTAAPDVSIVGKLAGGIFVYAMSILDAYRHARLRYETWRNRRGAPSSG